MGVSTRDMKPVRRRGGRSVLVALLIAGLLAVPAGADTGNPPTLVDTFGGPLHAAMYPSGLETSPTDGTVVIADTGNNQVAKFAADGTQVWRVGTFGNGTNEFDNPRDIAIDELTGNIVVVDTRNSRLVRLSPAGEWLGAFGGTTGNLINFPMGATIENGVLYLADTGRKKVRQMDPNTWAETRTIVPVPDGGSGPSSGCRNFQGIRDATADDAGNVYIAGYKTNDVVKVTPSGTCTSWGGTGTGPGKFRTPYGTHTGLDPVLGQEVLWVADGLNSRVQEFTLTGTYLGELGTHGDPDQPGTVTTMRRSALARDGSGDVWIADLWGFRIERFDRGPAGYTPAQTIGMPLQGPTDTAVFHEPRGVAVGPDGVTNIIDTVHQQFVRMDATGHIVGTCGTRADEGAALGEFNWPRGLAIDPVTGEIWVADTKQHRVQIIRPDCSGVQWLGETYAGSSLTAFNWPYDVAIRAGDRKAFVVDNQNHRIKVYDVGTRSVLSTYGGKGTGFSQFTAPGGIGVSPVNGNIFVADTKNNRVKEVSTSDGVSWTTIRNITGFTQPEDVAVDAQGRIYVADSGADRVVVLDAGLSQTATVTADGLHHPSAVNIGPDGRVFVSDTYNDRVLVYEWSTAPPFDTTAPDAIVTVPSTNQSFPLGVIPMSGTATDNVGVSKVSVAIRRMGTSQWWTGSAWGSYTKLPAVLGTPGGTSTSWSYDWPAPATGSFGVSVIAEDAAGNVDPTKPWVTFGVASAPDTIPPNGTVTSPTPGQRLPTGLKTFGGTATDNVGVATARVAIRNNTTGQWWTGSAWGSAFGWNNATVAVPGSASTTWSYDWTPPGTGSYGLQLRVDDAAGNQDPTKPWVTFSVI